MKKRERRNDVGIKSFIRSLFQDGMGLSPKTTDRMVKIITSSGELAQSKKHIRTMKMIAYKRFNIALDMAMKSDEDAKDVSNNDADDQLKEEIEFLNSMPTEEITFLEYLLSESPKTKSTETPKPTSTLDIQIATARERLARLTKQKSMRNRGKR